MHFYETIMHDFTYHIYIKLPISVIHAMHVIFVLAIASMLALVLASWLLVNHYGMLYGMNGAHTPHSIVDFFYTNGDFVFGQTWMSGFDRSALKNETIVIS